MGRTLSNGTDFVNCEPRSGPPREATIHGTNHTIHAAAHKSGARKEKRKDVEDVGTDGLQQLDL